MFNHHLALSLSGLILNSFKLRMFVQYQNRIPQDATVIVISNHRSFMDALILMQALSKPLRIACHHYMGQVPLLRELVTSLGCFPLAQPHHRGRMFLKQGRELLQHRQWLGVFPEGGKPMVKLSSPTDVGEFEPGFAHLALTAKFDDLIILPVAIASEQEQVQWSFPLEWLQFFDPQEPLFNHSEHHPVVIYERVTVLIGHPYWITDQKSAQYHGKNKKIMINYLCDYCRQEIIKMLEEHNKRF